MPKMFRHQRVIQSKGAVEGAGEIGGTERTLSLTLQLHLIDNVYYAIIIVKTDNATE